MVEQLGRVSDILTHSFYAQGESISDTAAYERFLDQSTIGRSPAEVARDPANIMGMYLPLLSFQDYEKFLRFGLDWFQKMNAPDAEKDMSKEAKLSMQKMLIDLLDGWHEALDKEASEKRRHNKSPMQRLVEAERSAIKNGDEENSSMRIAALGILTSQIGLFPGARTVSSMRSVTGAWRAVEAFLAPTIAESVGITIGYFTTMTAMQAAVFTPAMAKALQKEGKYLPAKQVRAHGFVTVLLQKIMSKKFDAYMESFIRDLGGEARLYSNEQMFSIIARVKLSYLMIALALLYKSETGGLTSIEIGDLIKGKMEVEEESLQGVIIKLIHLHVKAIPPALTEEILNSILTYFDESPPVEELLNPAQAFEGILGASESLPVFRQSV